MLVALPLGCWLGAWVFDLIGAARGNPLLDAASFYCNILGIVGAVLAAIPGVIDLFGAVPARSSGRQRGLLHGGLNLLVLALFVFVAVHRGSADVAPDKLELLLATLAVIGLGFSGWLGGTLAYRNQIGVDRRYANAGKLKERAVEDWSRPVCNQSELSDGQVLLARVGGERLVVGRCEDGLFAFSDHCTHKGGPLSDGALVGCTVQCPWHGSQFDIKTGRVVSGPAEEKIEVFETEVRGGEVYVKPKEKKEKPKKAA
jgi:nitrite reductase/ring-hydroxylating ferredoxin subunit/uncharacterized membrane protein